MKKIISLLLAIVMVFSAMPVAAFADETAPTIIFETTFTDEMTEGDEFTVTAKIEADSNPGFNSFALPLIWNEEVLEFNGFEMTYDEDAEEDVLYTEALSAFEVFMNGGTITGARARDTKKDGILFVANFTVKGPGYLDIGFLMSNPTDTSKQFQMGNNAGSSLTVAAAENINDTAIEGLAVAADEPVGPAIPDGAPFTAITTDAGAAIAIEKQENVSFNYADVPYYIVTIPADAATVYVTDPNQVVLQDYTSGEMKASAYAADIASGWSQLYVNYDYTEVTGGIQVTVPLNMTAEDMTMGTVEMCFVEDGNGSLTHAYGGEDSNYACTFLMSFQYDGIGEDAPETYSINIDENIVGGTVSVQNENGDTITEAAAGDLFILSNEPATGYQFKHYLINDAIVTQDALGMTNGLYQMPAEDITVSAVFEANHTCTYDQEVVDEKYLKSEATCQTGAVYYKSCKCELFDNSETAATFVSGEKVDHDYVDGVCKWCSEAATEPILSFTAGGQTLEAVTAEDYCSEFEVTAQKLTVTVPAGVNTVTINCAASMCAYIDHVSSDLSPSGKSAEIDLTQDLTFVCVPVTLDDGSDAYYHVYFEQEAGDVDPEPEDPAVTPGYFFATSADVSTENGSTAVVHVKITGHSDPDITTYNAYDLTLTFDTDKLEYQSYDGAVKSDNGSVTVNGNTIRIVGCGADKEFGTEIAALTFKTKAEGNADVTISKVQVSDKEESVKEDAPEATPKHDENDTTADTTPDQSVVQVPYTVSKPEFVSGKPNVLHGKDYTFSYTDTDNYTYTGLKVTVGGTEVTPTESDGVYTIKNVTGAVNIEVTQTPNSYDVTKPDNVTFNGLDKATYGIDYIFTVTPNEGKVIDTVTVTTASGTIPCTINENGEYVIEGTDISGPFSITVTEEDKPVATTTITFNGVDEAEVDGGLTQTAPIGKEFTFQLNKDEKFTYTAKVGETVLTETEGKYTIPAELVVESGVIVTITKEEIKNLTVEVNEYISLDGKVMFLVTAKWDDKVLSYGEGNTMFRSSKYDAYCWLVISTEEMNTCDLVKAAAEAAIVEAAEGATAIAYDYDVNQTTKVDVNDAQLVYDMYNASYMEFTNSLPMLKFLEADVTADRKLDVNDVAAVINRIVNSAAN